MLKPNSTFKLSKSTKRTLALSKWKSKEQRDAWKNSMIQAELTAALQPKREKNRREGNTNNGSKE